MSEVPLPPAVQNTDEYTQIWRGVRDDFLEAAHGRPGPAFTERPADGSWSVSELAEHLYLTQFFFARSIPICLNGKLGYDMDTVEPVVYDGIFDRVARAQGVRNPPRVTPEKGWDMDTALNKLNQSETAMLKNLEQASLDGLRSRGYDHPLYGPVSVLDWLWLLTLHEKAHLDAMLKKFPKD